MGLGLVSSAMRSSGTSSTHDPPWLLWPPAKPVPCRRRGESSSLFSRVPTPESTPGKVPLDQHDCLKLSGCAQTTWQHYRGPPEQNLGSTSKDKDEDGWLLEWQPIVATLSALPFHCPISQGRRWIAVEPSTQERLFLMLTSFLFLSSVAKWEALFQHPRSPALLILRQPPPWLSQGQSVCVVCAWRRLKLQLVSSSLKPQALSF